MMKIGIIGASGKAGQMITAEAVAKGHTVTAIVRDAKKVTNKDVAVLERDLFDLTFEDIADFDVLVDAFNAPHGHEELHKTSLAHLVTLLKGHKAPRLMVVGGAGSLYVDPEMKVRVMDTPDFPDAFKPTASNMGEAFDQLKAKNDVTWTYISPSAMFLPDGAKTGAYVIGKDHLLVNAAGSSEISYADFATALVDEAEAGKHINERFTVGAK